jgi:type IV pilus assembly protein PilA
MDIQRLSESERLIYVGKAPRRGLDHRTSALAIPLLRFRYEAAAGLQRCRRAQDGFSLVEVSIVMAIVLLLAIIAIPAVSAYVIESKVPKVGEELARFILHTQVNASNGTSTPYDGIGNINLANMVRDSSIFSISGDQQAPTVRHGLGSDGDVSVAEADAGAAFTITLSKVNHAACPAIASVMQRVANTITLTPQGGAAAVIKAADTPYSALETESRCSQGDGNTFVFTAG